VTALRDHLVLWVNGVRREFRGAEAFLTASDFLRDRLGLVGTKVVCAEGDCGACTVLVARPEDGRHLPIDSCIRFMFQLDGCHVVTVEGLAEAGRLAPVQQAMVDCHGSQCGFCTPGFVMTLAGARATPPGRPVDWPTELAGNLCRCTGYVPIVEAAERAAAESGWLERRYPEAAWRDEAARLRRDALDLHGPDGRRVIAPVTLAAALEARAACPEARPVAGATDLGVQWNKGRLTAATWLDLSRVDGLGGVAVETRGGEATLVAGALATWTECLDACAATCPEFARILEVFGGPQIRHVGTLGGNIVNGSPIADSLPFLFVADAELELASVRGRRRVPITGFYRGYKQLDLRPDELLVGVRVPLPAADEVLRLVKVSRRLDLDISTLTAAVRLRLDGDTIAAAAIALGGVGPVVLRLRDTEAWLVGRPFTERTCRQAGDRMAAEIAPLSDVRGSAAYRRQLARTVLVKVFLEHARGREALA
jgi:xanthine dehydrogenase small subunit